MARKKAQPREKRLWAKAKWRGFINARLNAQEKAAVKEMDLDGDTIAQFCADVAAAGYKVGLSYSIPEDVYTVSLTGQYVAKANAGMTLSMRHRDFATAMAAIAWCVDMDGFDADWAERFGGMDSDDW